MTTRQCYRCGNSVDTTARQCPSCASPLLLNERYRLQRVLGKGGFSVVYEALDTRLHRLCAVKAINVSSLAEQQQVETEVEILSRYASRFAFIPDIYDLWNDQARIYLAMEYIEGRTIDTLSAQPWPPAQVEAFLITLLEDLAQIHAVGIIHRDLKPKNIVAAAQGRYVLLDFGIAKQHGITLAAAKAFSPDYASPEQMIGAPTDARSDLYSLAATAYRLLTGRAPPRADARLANQALVESPRRIAPTTPRRLETALSQMLALDPADRPSDANTALALLRADQTTVPKAHGPVAAPSRRWSLWWVTALLALVIAGGGVFAWASLQSDMVVGQPPMAPQPTATQPLERNLSALARISASSVLAPQQIQGLGLVRYDPANVFDGNPATAWVEGVSKTGLGEHLTLTFEQPVTVTRIGFVAGYDSDERIFRANNRVRAVRLVFSDGTDQQLAVQDQRGMQYQQIGNRETTSILIEVTAVYPGETYDDTAIAEIEVWGYE